MEKLEQLSVNLVQENEELRSHYHNRTDDIKKLTHTMTINTNENYSDIRHLIATFRNRNGAMIRNI